MRIDGTLTGRIRYPILGSPKLQSTQEPLEPCEHNRLPFVVLRYTLLDYFGKVNQSTATDNVSNVTSSNR